MGWIQVMLWQMFWIAGISAKSFPKISCQACHPLAEDKINVHLIPHSHDDAGWRQTFDHYYEGNGRDSSRITESDPSVRLIISSMVEALKANPDRRFIQVEISFFWKWWQEQPKSIQSEVRHLVEQGRLEIINGGWVMNDEATTNYQAIIDQFTWGFRIINETVGNCGIPKIGWQIDPFGHSEQHARILKQMGFEGLFLGRLDVRDKDERIKKHNLEFMWQTKENTLDGSDEGLFTSIFPKFYTTPDGFCVDYLCSDRVSPDNARAKAQELSSILDGYKDYYKTNNILIPMGGDFHFQVASTNFESIDNLIQGFSNDENYNVFYSTPSCYLKAVKDKLEEKSLSLEKYIGDFFPYADKTSAYWTGFFTSRPTLKRFERTGHAILQSAKQLTALSRIHGYEKDTFITSLREIMGLLQHHDALTGTEKQKVANDYVRMLTSAIRKAEQPMGVIVGNLLKKEPKKEIDLKLSTCLLRNVSICEISSSRDNFYVVIYNPLARPVSHFVRLPVNDVHFKIVGEEGSDIDYDVFDTISSFEYVNDPVKPSSKELIFKAQDIPGFGLKLYYIRKLAGPGMNYHSYESLTEETTFGSDLGTGFKVDENGLLTSIKINNLMRFIKQEFFHYLGKSNYNLGAEERPSGAYIFNPENKAETAIKLKSTKYAKGTIAEELIQEFDEHITQIIRLYKNTDKPFIEFDWLVGDLQLEGKNGKEIITRFTMNDFNSKETFYTDSNGREMLKRFINKRNYFKGEFEKDPISSNYYPITSKIKLVDEEQQLEFAVLNDRAQGGSSLTNGSIEFMIHRRLAVDDGLGVNEVLSENEYGKGLFVRGKHLLTFGKIYDRADNVRGWERELENELLLEPWILLGENTQHLWNKTTELFNFEFKGMKNQLPENVNILTFEPWKDNYLLRLEHLYEQNTDPSLSKEATVDLKDLFTSFNITNTYEQYLGANQDKNNDDKELSIKLKPLQIRTFIIETDGNNLGGHDIFSDDRDNTIHENNSSIGLNICCITVLLSLLTYII